MTGFRTGRLVPQDRLYEKEKDYNDQQLSIILSKPPVDIQKMKTAEKREILMRQKRRIEKIDRCILRKARLEHHRHPQSRNAKTNRPVEFLKRRSQNKSHRDERIENNKCLCEEGNDRSNLVV